MTLKMEVENVDQEDSIRIFKACMDEITEINLSKSSTEPQIVMGYECYTNKPEVAYRESTPFTRYMNSTKKE